MTTTFFEKIKIAPRGLQKLKATVYDKTISVKDLSSGSVEDVYYGQKKIDPKGNKSEYKLTQYGIEQDYDDSPRLLMIYDWHDHSYICLANIGDNDSLGDAEGTCPYEIVNTRSGNHLGGK